MRFFYDFSLFLNITFFFNKRNVLFFDFDFWFWFWFWNFDFDFCERLLFSWYYKFLYITKVKAYSLSPRHSTIVNALQVHTIMEVVLFASFVETSPSIECVGINVKLNMIKASRIYTLVIHQCQLILTLSSRHRFQTVLLLLKTQ